MVNTFTFMHLADAFIQSDLQCIQAIHLYCQYMCSLGIEPTTFALLMQCSTTEPQEHNSKYLERIFTRDSLISLKLNTNIISPFDTMLWYRLEDLNSAECGLFL